MLARGALVAASVFARPPPCGRSRAAAAPSRAPPILREVGVVQRLGPAPSLDAIFQDEQGRAVRLGQYFGKRPVVLVLAYYNCPMLCTQVLNGMLASLKTLSFDAGKEFEVVTVSFDPREKPADAAAKKKPYIEAHYAAARPAAGIS